MEGAPVKLAQLWSDTSAARVGNDPLIHGAAARSSDDVRNNKADGAKGHSQCGFVCEQKDEEAVGIPD